MKNYSQKQIILDRENFNPAAAYNLAGRVFWKNFAFKYKPAIELKDDLIQEAVTRLFELSGKKSTDKRYTDNYARFWIAHNAMLAFMKTWLKQVRYKELWSNIEEIAVESWCSTAVFLG
ncbi:MAG: hypothetical protein CVU64_15110 [Deltaproteobacteria bacterium HGW-Deltaproteobacteria-21]|nr:MAG: hypothetical protein CVU64_15110 [Deltaproteobacteria bacterium HGW-Deltaproteobacteria-21]